MEAWPGSELTYVTAQVVIYEGIHRGQAPKHLAGTVDDLPFEPTRTSNCETSKHLEFGRRNAGCRMYELAVS